MTDNEIIKALECCFGSEGLCPRQQCPFYEKKKTKKKCTNDESLAMYAHDLIIQLKAENTELQRKNVELQYENLAINHESSKQRKEDGKNEIIYSENKVEFGRN